MNDSAYETIAYFSERCVKSAFGRPNVEEIQQRTIIFLYVLLIGYVAAEINVFV